MKTQETEKSPVEYQSWWKYRKLNEPKPRWESGNDGKKSFTLPIYGLWSKFSVINSRWCDFHSYTTQQSHITKFENRKTWEGFRSLEFTFNSWSYSGVAATLLSSCTNVFLLFILGGVLFLDLSTKNQKSNFFISAVSPNPKTKKVYDSHVTSGFRKLNKQKWILKPNVYTALLSIPQENVLCDRLVCPSVRLSVRVFSR